MQIKKYLTFMMFLLTPIGVIGFEESIGVIDFEESAIIYNSTTVEEQQIALGIRKEGQMGALLGNIAENAPDTGTGIAYKFDGSRSQGYKSGWYDATTPGCLCEGWGAGFVDRVGRQSHGRANEFSGGVQNIEVKSFVSDETSITSTVWIKDSLDQTVLEVTHRFGPAAKVPGALFQALVTMTNISGDSLQDVRYNRTMDWDVPPTEFNEYVTIKGAAASAASPNTPKILYSGDNGFMTPDPFSSSRSYGSYRNRDVDRGGPRDHGFTATFKLGELLCGEAHTFMIYYGAAADRPTMEAAFVTEDVPLYSIGESADRKNGDLVSPSDVSYGFGFKGLSGSAIAPSLPTKTAILPGGIETDEEIIQTYASSVLYDKSLYQAIFKFRKDKQWEGDILKYSLDDDGSISTSPPGSANSKLQKALLQARLESDTPYEDGGRSIWTVGNDPDCGGLLTKPSNNNNFIKVNTDQLEQFLFNCEKQPDDKAMMLVRFVRGADIHNEDEDPLGGEGRQRPRIGLLGDTFHSE
ncbi:hypothetical protein N9A22_04745, partial [Methylophilaceae bacterium]|nr:hypothetical protein [Methylophilaceae bacterium]